MIAARRSSDIQQQIDGQPSSEIQRQIGLTKDKLVQLEQEEKQLRENLGIGSKVSNNQNKYKYYKNREKTSYTIYFVSV